MHMLNNGNISRCGGVPYTMHVCIKSSGCTLELYRLYPLSYFSKAEETMRNLGPHPDLLMRVSGGGVGPGVYTCRRDPREILRRAESENLWMV